MNREDEVSYKTLPPQQTSPQVPLARSSMHPCSSSKEVAAVSIWRSLLPSGEGKREVLLRLQATEAVTGVILPYIELKPLLSDLQGPVLVLLSGVPTAILALFPRVKS